MPARKRKAIGEAPRLGSSFHATLEMSRGIVEIMREKRISSTEAEKIYWELKKKRQK